MAKDTIETSVSSSSESKNEQLGEGMVKRIGNLFERICSMDNLLLAYKESRRGKQHLEQVRLVDKDPG